MDIRHLRYFIAVVEEQSFTKAANRLFIAQPPLSRQIQDLENELGLQLLERGSRPVKSTEAGQFFYQHAKKVLASIEQMTAMTKRVGTVEDVLRIGFVGSLLFGLLPRIIHEFRKRQPYTKIELIEMGTQTQVEALKQGKIDVGFGRLRFSDPAVKRVLLRTEPLVLAVHASHSFLQTHPDGIWLADVVDEHILVYPTGSKPNFSTHLLSIFSEHGLSPNFVHEVREVQLALGLVASGEGVAIVPESTSSMQLHNLHYIPILDAGVVSPIFIAVRNMEESEYIDSLFDTIQAIYQEVGFPVSHHH